MKHTVEFLPPRYRQRRAARRSLLRRIGGVAAVGAGIAAASAWQHGQERAARQELAKVEAREQVVLANSRQLEELRWELAHARAAAELCVFLGRPWPRTRILAAVEGAAPAQIELTELAISQEAIAPVDSVVRRPLGRGGAPRTAAEEGPPASRDLRRLVEETGRMRTIVRVAGAAADPAIIHGFVANLSRDAIFDRTELGSLETLELPERGTVTRFEVRIVLRDEFGAASPVEPNPAAAVQTAGRTP
jgi:hypothetical protein